MASFFSFLNSFVPFADPSRPLWRDVVLSAILCTALYIAPKIDVQHVRSFFLNLKVPTEQHDGGVDEHHNEDQRVEQHQDETGHINPNDDIGEPHEAVEQVGEQQEEGEAADAGINRHQPRPRDPNREVGAKKAKSIARRNQQRAYNEFLREQGDAQRAEWARDEKARDDEAQVERARSAAIDAKVREKERQEREARKTKEEMERQAELDAVKSAIHMIEERLEKKQIVSAREVAQAVKKDEEWVQRLARREGLLGTKIANEEKEVVMLTKSGWFVRISSRSMESVYQQTAASCGYREGKASWSDIERTLQNTIVKG